MNNTVTGKVYMIGEVETFKNDFTVKRLVIETDEKYPQKIAVDFIKDNIKKLDNTETGQEVTVSYNLRGSEYKGKHYVTLNGWRIESENAVDNMVNEAREKAMPVEDDLPF